MSEQDPTAGGRVAAEGGVPRPETALAAASARPWVLEPEGTASREWAEQLCRQAGFEPDVRFETADLMAHIRLIRSGNAVGVLPDLVWAGEAGASSPGPRTTPPAARITAIGISRKRDMGRASGGETHTSPS